MMHHLPKVCLTIVGVFAVSLFGVRQTASANVAGETRHVRVAAISLTWDTGHRTLEATLAALDQAGQLKADLACLPQECVDQSARAGWREDFHHLVFV